MKINRENYESYFIDLIDGTMPTDKVDELLDFLSENPDLSEELDGLKRIQFDDDESVKFNTQSLLKSDFDHPDIFEDACIRSIENELTKQEELKLQNYLSTHRHAENDYRLFSATVSEPDSLVEFQNKDSLKRFRKILPFWYSAAAVLLIGVLFWFNSNKHQPVENIAKIIPSIETQTLELPIQPQQAALVVVIKKSVSVKVEPIKKEPELVLLKAEVIKTLSATHILATFEITNTENFDLVPVKKLIPNKTNQQIFPSVGELMANEINNLDSKEEMSNLAKSALSKMKDVTNDKLDFATNNQGKVNKIEFNSRFLAFSISVNSRN